MKSYLLSLVGQTSVASIVNDIDLMKMWTDFSIKGNEITDSTSAGYTKYQNVLN